jgi:hypothetical protein
MANKIPQLGSSVRGISEVYDMIKNPEYVRPTTRIDNLKRAIDRGTESTVVRSAGYNKLFQTFLKNGISSATVNKFKLIPDIADFDNAKSYSEALKKFRNTAFKGLSNAQLRIVESSGFLSQYAKDQRLKLLKSGKNFDMKNLNKVLDQMYDFTFMTEKSAAGVAKPKLQSKIYTQIRDMAKRTLNKAQRLNLDYALSQVDDLFKSGKVVKAAKMLAGISTLVAKGAFGKALPVVGNLITTEMGSGELTPEGIEEFKKDQTQARMNKRGGGLMDINYMTRPLGYHEGGAIRLKPGQALYDKDGNLIMELPGALSEREMEQIIKLNPGQTAYDAEGNQVVPKGQISDFEQGLLKLSPGQKMYDAEGNVVTEDQLPYDPNKGSTENLNELITDIGGTLKEKIKGAGKSLLDKINDFLKYGHGDRENYMEIGGEQVDPEDPNFRRFIEENYMGEGESYIEGIENYRREAEGSSYRRGGIVSLNHMTRSL